MPVVPAAVVSPYPTVEAVMNRARVRVDDTALGLSGELLADTMPYSETLLNLAWDWLQTRMANAGIELTIREVIITGLPIAANVAGNAPAVAALTWLGCTDGVNQYDQPNLPADLNMPLDVHRDNGNGFVLMSQADNGLTDYTRLLDYDWRSDGMYFFPTDTPTNFRVRYSAKFAPLSLATAATTLVPVLFCEDALSARVAFEFCNMRGAAQTVAMQQLADAAFQMLAQRTARKNERRSLRRLPYSNRLR